VVEGDQTASRSKHRFVQIQYYFRPSAMASDNRSARVNFRNSRLFNISDLFLSEAFLRAVVGEDN
jgi:hypothetical protein